MPFVSRANVNRAAKVPKFNSTEIVPDATQIPARLSKDSTVSEAEVLINVWKKYTDKMKHSIDCCLLRQPSDFESHNFPTDKLKASLRLGRCLKLAWKAQNGGNTSLGTIVPSRQTG